MVLLDHRALRDQADLVHREETRGRQEDLADRLEEARGHQESQVEEEVQVDVPRPWGRAQAEAEDQEVRQDQEVRRVVHHPHRRRHTRLDRTQIGEKWSTENSFAFT